MPTQQGPLALRQAIYRFDIWADTAAEVMGVMKQMCAALDGYRGLFKDVSLFPTRGREPGRRLVFGKTRRTAGQ